LGPEALPAGGTIRTSRGHRVGVTLDAAQRCRVRWRLGFRVVVASGPPGRGRRRERSGKAAGQTAGPALSARLRAVLKTYRKSSPPGTALAARRASAGGLPSASLRMK